MIGAVILAAGAGRRLGGVAKALLPIDDTTFLGRIVATARAAGVGALVVVVGPPHRDAVATLAAALGAGVVDNPDPGRGMASSIGLGFAALPAAVDAALLWPVDHPWVAAATVRALIAAGEGVPVHRDRGGHPPLIARRHFAALTDAAAHRDGARGILRGQLARIAVDDPAVLRDVDHPADLAELPCAS